MSLTVVSSGAHIIVSPAAAYRGHGYFAGEAPVSGSPDGRFKILGVPAKGRIVVFERTSMIIVAETMSASDGTWRIDYLDPTLLYTVIGYDDTGAQNSAIQDWVKPALMVP